MQLPFRLSALAVPLYPNDSTANIVTTPRRLRSAANYARRPHEIYSLRRSAPKLPFIVLAD
jgi:hypothetical protein